MFIDALLSEINEKSSFFEGENTELTGEKPKTIYIGGGTPSLLTPAQLGKIISALEKTFFGGDLSKVKEFTIEVNPDDTGIQYYKDLISLGFNRVSIGVQSFCDDELRWMNRRHNSFQAISSFYDAREAGFKNISTDLIFGIGLDNGENWKKNLKVIRELRPKHISAYQLGVESGTKLDRMVKSGEYSTAEQEFSLMQYSLLQGSLSEAGYNQYEISSFCLENFRSIHNSSYWNHTPYLGLGPSAHSYSNGVRSWNRKSVTGYILAKKNGRRFSSEEILSKKDIFNEKIMLSLRTTEGILISDLESGENAGYMQEFLKNVSGLIDKGSLVKDGERVKIPPDKLFVSDGIIRELFIP